MSGIAFPTDASAGAPSYAALSHRLGRVMEYMGDGTTFGTLGGMRPGGAPVPALVTLQATFPPFACVVDGGTSSGTYECAFTANEVVNLTARPGSNSRIDRIEVQVPTEPPSGGIRVANVVYTAGTAAPSPVPPAASARAVTVGFYTVPSGVGAITWAPSTVLAVSAGGVLPAPTTGFPASGYDGQLVYDQTLDLLEARNGSGNFDQIGYPAAALAYTGTAATFSPANGVDTLINNWNALDFNDGDIVHASGVVTVTRAGKYRIDATITWPGTSAAYRSRVFFYLNGSAVTRGRQAYQSTSAAGVGSLDTTTSWPFKLAAGGTLGVGINVSTAGVTGVTPSGLAVTRVG